MFRKYIVYGCFVCLLIATCFLPAGTAFAQSDEVAWAVRCEEDEQGNAAHCEMFTRLNLKDTDTRLVEFALGYPKEGDQVARGIIIVPLGILLQEDVVLSVDEEEKLRARPRYCSENGCYVYVTLPESLVSAMKRGNEASLMFRAANGRPVAVKVSLAGFTKTTRTLQNK
ncbi:MAG: invasion associated locus B family protein [Alphaproteobacteria bacterium]